MPHPITANITERNELGSLVQYDLLMNMSKFIGTRVLPLLDVTLVSDNIGKVPLEHLLQSSDTTRADGDTFSRGQFKFDKWSYTCQEYGHEEPLTDRARQRWRHLIDAEDIVVKRAAHKVLEHAERRTAELVFNATTWTGASLKTSVTNEWDDYVNATPIADVKAAKDKVWQNSGLDANALIINRAVFENLRLCEEIKDAITASGAGSRATQRDVTEDLLAQVFDLDRVIVAGGTKNTAAEGASRSLSRIWSSEYAMVARVCVSNDPQEPGLGNTFHFTETGSLPLGVIETYRDESRTSDIYRVRYDADEVIKYKEAAHLLDNITT